MMSDYTGLDNAEANKMVSADEEQQAAYEHWLYMKYAKDATSEAFKAGFRLGYIAANKAAIESREE